MSRLHSFTVFSHLFHAYLNVTSNHIAIRKSSLNASVSTPEQQTSSKTQKRTGSIDEVDMNEVSNEVEMYFPARKMQFNIQNLDEESNVADGFTTQLSDTESG